MLVYNCIKFPISGKITIRNPFKKKITNITIRAVKSIGPSVVEICFFTKAYIGSKILAIKAGRNWIWKIANQDKITSIITINANISRKT